MTGGDRPMAAACQNFPLRTRARPPFHDRRHRHENPPAKGWPAPDFGQLWVFRDLVATTDGIIFHLWPAGDRIPTGAVEIGQAVGHRPMGREEYTRSASPTEARGN